MPRRASPSIPPILTTSSASPCSAKPGTWSPSTAPTAASPGTIATSPPCRVPWAMSPPPGTRSAIFFWCGLAPPSELPSASALIGEPLSACFTKPPATTTTNPQSPPVPDPFPARAASGSPTPIPPDGLSPRVPPSPRWARLVLSAPSSGPAAAATLATSPSAPAARCW